MTEKAKVSLDLKSRRVMLFSHCYCPGKHGRAAEPCARSAPRTEVAARRPPGPASARAPGRICK